MEFVKSLSSDGFSDTEQDTIHSSQLGRAGAGIEAEMAGKAIADLKASIAELEEANGRYMKAFIILNGSETHQEGDFFIIKLSAEEYAEVEELT
jgi:hypothetical protein